MSDNFSLNQQLQELLTNLSNNRIYHLSEMEDDLLQVHKLLKEAIETLGNSFMEIARAVHLQQDMLGQIVKDGNNTEEKIEEWKAVFHVIEDNVSSAVTGLQFEDMTNQLVFRVLDRILGMRLVAATLEKLKSEIALETDSEQIARLLKGTSQLLIEQNDELNGHLSSQVVSQQSLNVGDIDLF